MYIWSRIYQMPSNGGKHFLRFIYGAIILLTGSAVHPRAMSQMVFDREITNNEVFGASIYDDSYPDLTMPSSPVETNLTAILLAHNENRLSNKVTTEGLDITSPEIFQSKTGAQFYSVLPGTIWCGVGNLAWNDRVLGFFSTTDSCCRTHDKCRLTISPGSSRFGLRNSGFFTRSHCMCDEKFYYCLKRTNTIISDKVGITYFNILRPQCFRKDFPIIACIRWYNRRCQTYVVDQGDDREWQWFDNREY